MNVRWPTSRMPRLVNALLVLTVLAGACGLEPDESAGGEGGSTDSTVSTTLPPTSSTTTSEPSTTSTSSVPPPLVDIMDWQPCGELECGTVTVPADYGDPGAGTISIAVNMLRASDSDRRIGVLMVNPGGPGAPGTDFVENVASSYFPEEITDRFDVVGFDPRGVGQSEPTFACGESGEQLDILTVVDELYDTPEEIAAGEAAVQLCVDSMGSLAGRIHTDFVVRDMDEIRRAMGEEQISYLGFSYGSLIGVWYATLFPDSVRAMVIDGANNPLDEDDTFEERLDSAREEMQPIEDLLLAALQACDETCPIYNGGDPIGYYHEAAAKFELINEANANNPAAALLSIVTPLYSEATWPQLWQALSALQEQDDPSTFSDLLEFQLGDDPGAANMTAHVNCLDGWALRPEKDREVRLAEAAEFAAVEDELDAEFPLLAAIETEGTGTCSFYDAFAPEPLSVPLDGGGVPILVVGNTSDPVTSFGESEEFASEILSNGHLVEVDHPNHTVYPSNTCVNEIVNAALIDTAYPTDVPTCAREGSDDGELLYEVCVEIMASGAAQFSAELTASVCADFVEQSFDRLGAEAVAALLYEDDAEAGEVALDILTALITLAGAET